MDRYRKRAAEGYRSAKRLPNATRSSAARLTWSPVAVAALAIGTLGAFIIRSGRADLRDIGLLLLGIGGVGVVGAWIAAVFDRQMQRRDTQAQINAGSHLDACDLTRADLRGAYVRHRQMNSVRLAHADCRRADFTSSTMNDAVFTRADLRGARFDNVGALELHCYRADLRGARFRGADLREAKLEEADLRDVDFANTDLTNADLRKADLRGADLSTAALTGVLFSGARYDERTAWPLAMSESQLSGRDLSFVSSERRLPALPRRLRRPVAATALAAGASIALLALVGTTAGTASSTDVLGTNETRALLQLEGEGLAYVRVDTASGDVINDIVELPAQWEAAGTGSNLVSVYAERPFGGGPLACAIEVGGEVVVAASDGGSTSEIGAVMVTCEATIGAAAG